MPVPIWRLLRRKLWRSPAPSAVRTFGSPPNGGRQGPLRKVRRGVSCAGGRPPRRQRRRRAENRRAAPQYIGVECRVCQTRMYGRLDQVGKQLKCPDCGAARSSRRRPSRRSKNMPAAMEGEQYELWGRRRSAAVAEMLAAQPKYIAVDAALPHADARHREPGRQEAQVPRLRHGERRAAAEEPQNESVRAASRRRRSRLIDPTLTPANGRR